MFGSYVRVVALLGLAVAVGCSSSDGDGGSAGSGGGAGTGGSGGDGGTAGDGGGGAGGEGEGGAGGEGGSAAYEKTISVGCTNSVTTDVSILEWDLEVTPEGPVTGEFTATIGGTATFAKAFLDAGLGLFPGLTRASLGALQATALVRSGATGDPVALLAPDMAGECNVTGDPCAEDAECPGAMFGEFCAKWINLPTSNHCDSALGGDGTCDGACDPGGACEQADAENGPIQCEANDFCVLGDLPLPLVSTMATFTAEASGVVLFGWDDVNTGATIDEGDGTYILPKANPATDPLPPNAAVIQIPTPTVPLELAIECTMAVDAGGDNGVGVPDQASPTPDELLIEVPIEE